MGARVARMFRNFNLENRVHREISKEKPRAAPRHDTGLPQPSSSTDGECLSLEAPLTCVTVSSWVLRGHAGLISSLTPTWRYQLSSGMNVLDRASLLISRLCVCLLSGDGEPEERPSTGPPEVRLCGVHRPGPSSSRGQTGTRTKSISINGDISHYETVY